ncbi:serine--tRNA ligase [Candidatus Auribacterota bacterium]
MLDIKFIREDPEAVKRSVKDRCMKLDVDKILELDRSRRELLSGVETLKNKRNVVSKEIGNVKRSGGDVSGKTQEMRTIGDDIKKLDDEIRDLEDNLNALLLSVPNMPHSTTPVGKSEADNKFVREWGSIRKFSFKPLPHWEIAENLDMVDFKNGTKVTGSHFPLFRGPGALLGRALINFMLDIHTRDHGFTEISPPFMVNRASMTGTGQLPKLEDDMYHIENDDLFLIPTAEVPVTNMHRDQIMDESQLPVYYTAYTPCFRREAGSYGKGVRGLTRVHQFDKVELVKFTLPEKSYEEHEKLLNNAEKILQLLGLPYRVRILCTADISFAAAKCYDIEVWSPGQETYLEVSSCSNFEDFQARRAGIRYRRASDRKVDFVHTLNASGVALPRTYISILENYQNEDGTVTVPEVLRKYVNGLEKIAR